MLQGLHSLQPINASATAAGAAPPASSSASSSMRPAKRCDRASAGAGATGTAFSSSSSPTAAGGDDDERRTRKRPNQQADPGESSAAAGGRELEVGGAATVAGVGEAAEAGGLRLLGLLLRCAEAVAMDRLGEARDLLPEITELSSPYGSPPERVAAYFAEALHSRIVSSHIGAYPPIAAAPTAALPLYRTLALIQNQRIAQAFHAFNSISPLVKFAHFTANQAISQALEGEESVHVIDLDIMQGLQWPGLFHILASRHGDHRIRSIRITGVGSSLDLLEATGRRLSDFAAALGLAFEFHPLEGKIGHIADPAMFRPQRKQGQGIHHGGRGGREEVTVVNWMQHCLYDVTGSDLGAVRLLRALRPRLVAVVEQDLGHAGGFLERFVEALHYYSAMFDALGEGAAAAAEGERRHLVERQLLGAEIRNILAVGGPKRTGEAGVGRWGEQLRAAGFHMVSLAGGPAAQQAGLLLGMLPCKGYTLVEEGGRLRLGWKDLSLLTASAWQPSAALLSSTPGEGGR